MLENREKYSHNSLSGCELSASLFTSLFQGYDFDLDR